MLAHMLDVLSLEIIVFRNVLEVFFFFFCIKTVIDWVYEETSNSYHKFFECGFCTS